MLYICNINNLKIKIMVSLIVILGLVYIIYKLIKKFIKVVLIVLVIAILAIGYNKVAHSSIKHSIIKIK